MDLNSFAILFFPQKHTLIFANRQKVPPVSVKETPNPTLYAVAVEIEHTTSKRRPVLLAAILLPKSASTTGQPKHNADAQLELAALVT